MNTKKMLFAFIRESIRDDDYDDRAAALADERSQTEEYNSWLMSQPEMIQWRKKMKAYRSPEEQKKEQEEADFNRQLALVKKWKDEEIARAAAYRLRAKQKKDRDLKDVRFDDSHEEYVGGHTSIDSDGEESGDGLKKNYKDIYTNFEDDWDL